MEKSAEDLEITIIGSGTGVISLERGACAVLMETGGKRLLFDIGPGTMHRLLEAGITVFDIDYLFISHFHPDHTGELVSFLFANRHPGTASREKKLTMVGGPGIRSFYERLRQAFGNWIELPGLLEITELDTDTDNALDFNAFLMKWAPMAHRPESVGFRIYTSSGKSAVYSGDTDFTEHLIRLAHNTDLLICDSALPDEMKVDGHMTPSLAGRIATTAGVSRLVLTHFYPECGRIDIKQQCRQTYDGPLDIARDLMKITLTDQS